MVFRQLLTEYDVLGAFWMTIKLTVALRRRGAGDRHRGRGHAGIAGRRAAGLRDRVRDPGAEHTR